MTASENPEEAIERGMTVMAEFQRVEDCLKDSLHRVDVIEDTLKKKLMRAESREELEKELERVKEVLKKNEARLKDLKKENTKSFMVAGSLIFASYLIYGLYCMIYNER